MIDKQSVINTDDKVVVASEVKPAVATAKATQGPQGSTLEATEKFSIFSVLYAREEDIRCNSPISTLMLRGEI